MTIGIQLYNLNIIGNLDRINLSWIVDNLPHKPQIKNFILCEQEISEYAETKLEKIFAEIWKKQVLHVIIIYWNRTLNAVSFTPFPKMKLVYIRNSDLENINSLFWDKSQNLYGYPLKVTGFYDISRALFDQQETSNLKALDGLDGLLSRLIVEKMNATLELNVPADGMEIGELFPNNTATGCLAALMSGHFDMGFNVRFYRLNHFEGRVEATHSIGRDDICFLVPRKGKAIDIANIFRPFHRCTWIVICILMPLYAFCYYLTVSNQQNKRSFRYHFFQFFAYTLQQPVNFIAKSKKEKFFIGIWIVSVMLIAFMYEGKMSGSLIIPKDRPNIESIEQLAQSDLKILSFSRYNRQIKEFFSDSKYNGVYDPLFERLQNISITEFYGSVSKMDSSYGFANKYHINAYLRRICIQNSEIFYHHIKQCPVPFLGVYGIRYGTPYRDRINFIIRQAQEGGLIDKWERNNEVKEQFSQAKLHGGHGTVLPFSVLHLQTAFYIYSFGCVIAAIACFCEHFVEQKKRKKDKIEYR